MFISSTYRDLAREREAAQEALRKGDSLPWGMEFFVSEPRRPLDVCLRELERCDAVILLVGARAGSLVPHNRESTYTEAEVQHALRRGLPLFVFCQTRDAAFQNDHRTSDPLHDKLEKFRTFVLNQPNVTARRFESLDQLGLEVLAAVTRWEREGCPGARRLFLSREDYYRLEAPPNRLLRHDTTLRGRTEELSSLDQFLANDGLIAVITAVGGAGKSKLIHEWTSRVDGRSVMFVKPGASWHSEVKKEVTAGDLLLVLDDAHRSGALLDNLVLLARELRESEPPRRVTLLLATRPMGTTTIDGVLSRRANVNEVLRVMLAPLGIEARRQLAAELLAPTYLVYRDALVSLAGDSPLVIVVGGRLIATGDTTLSELTTEEEFRHEVLNRFVEDLGSGAEEWRPLLDLIAILGPIHPSTPAFTGPAENLLSLPVHKLARGLRMLEERGLVIRTSRYVKVCLDVLADHLVEIVAIDADGSTGYVESVFSAFDLSYIENLLVNLSDLVWRLEKRGTSAPMLLFDAVWARLGEAFTQDQNRSTVLQAVARAAAYQPGPALRFARAADSVALHEFDRAKINEILQIAAYDPLHTREAVSRLWSEARSDTRQPNAHPSHAGRLLTELAGFGRFKPLEISERVLDLMIERMEDAEAFDLDFTPLSIADKLLEREIEDNESTETGITLRRLGLNYDAVGPTRKKSMALVSSALFMPSAKAQRRAVKSMEAVLYGFVPAFGRAIDDEEEAWQDQERFELLEVVRDRLQSDDIAPGLEFSLRHTLASARGTRSDDPLTTRIDSVLAVALHHEQYIDILSAVSIASWQEPGIMDHTRAETVNQARVAQASQTFRAITPEPGLPQLLALEELVGHAELYDVLDDSALYQFCMKLCHDPAFLDGLIARAFEAPTSKCSTLLHVALQRLRDTDHQRFVHQSQAALDSEETNLRTGAAHVLSYGSSGNETAEFDLRVLAERRGGPHQRRNILRQIGQSVLEDHSLTSPAVSALRRISVTDEASANALCCALDVIADLLSDDDIDAFLEKLVAVPRLDEYDIGQYLARCAKRCPELVLNFLVTRLNEHGRRESSGDFAYHATPDSLRTSDFSGLRDASTYESVLRQIRDNLLRAEAPTSPIVELFWRIGALDIPSLFVIDEWIHESSETAGLLEQLIRQAPQSIALERPGLAVHLAEGAAQWDPALGARIESALASGATPNHWSSAPGQIPAVFLAAIERAELLDEYWSKLGCRLFRRIAARVRHRAQQVAQSY